MEEPFDNFEAKQSSIPRNPILQIENVDMDKPAHTVENDILIKVLDKVSTLEERLEELEKDNSKVAIRKWAIEEEMAIISRSANPSSITYTKFLLAKKIADFVLRGKVEK